MRLRTEISCLIDYPPGQSQGRKTRGPLGLHLGGSLATIVQHLEHIGDYNQMSDPTQTEWDDSPFPQDDRFITPWEHLLNTQPPSFTIQGILPKGQVAWLYGATGIGKSLIASDLALSVAYGNLAFQHFETQQTNVLWLDYENGQEEHIQRLKSAGWTPKQLATDNHLHIGTFPESINPENSFTLIQEINRHQIGLLVIDSSGVGIEGDSNSADTYADFAQHLLNPLKKQGCTVLVLDNIGKDATRGAIGSSRKTHEAGATWKLTHNTGTWSLTAIKRRTLGLEHAISIKQTTNPLRYILTNATEPKDLNGEQLLIVQYLQQLPGSKALPAGVLKDILRKAGFSMNTTLMQDAIRAYKLGVDPGVA
jgi:hypothetical protein